MQRDVPNVDQIGLDDEECHPAGENQAVQVNDGRQRWVVGRIALHRAQPEATEHEERHRDDDPKVDGQTEGLPCGGSGGYDCRHDSTLVRHSIAEAVGIDRSERRRAEEYSDQVSNAFFMK